MANKVLAIALLASLVASGWGQGTPRGLLDSVGIGNQRNPELISGTTDLIDKLVQNLQQSATTAAQAVSNFTSGIHEQAAAFGSHLTSEVSKIREDVNESIKNITNRAGGVSAAVAECLEKKKQAAEDLINGAVSSVSICAEEKVSQIVGLVSELIEVTKSASTVAQEVQQQAVECATGTSNLFTIGTCLWGLLWKTEVKAASIAGRSGLLIAKINIALLGLPAKLQVCAASKLGEIAEETRQIIKDIAQCSFTAVTSNA